MKILGSDFDGTLTYGGMTEEKFNTIHRWRAAGNRFGIVTGRSAPCRAGILKDFPLLEADFFSCFNGGTLLGPEGNVVYETYCDTVDTLRLAKDLLGWGCSFLHMETDPYYCIISRPEDKPSWANEKNVRLIDTFTKLGPFHQISVALGSVEEARAVIELIKGKYGDKVIPLQNANCIDLVPPGVNKAQGLYRAMELFGGRYEDVIAVGDNINDIDMLREFRSYAMEQAPDEVKQVADFVTAGVDQLMLLEMDKH